MVVVRLGLAILRDRIRDTEGVLMSFVNVRFGVIQHYYSLYSGSGLGLGLGFGLRVRVRVRVRVWGKGQVKV